MEKRTKSGRKQSGWWPTEKRVEVVTAYIALGKSNLVEAVTGVPPGTVRQWKTQDWWRELEYQLREEDNLELDSKLKKIVNRSLDAVLDRLENGDFFYDVKSGTISRMPAKLRDVAKVSADAVDKSLLLQKFTKKVEETPKLDDHLRKLALAFADVVKSGLTDTHDKPQEDRSAATVPVEIPGPDQCDAEEDVSCDESPETGTRDTGNSSLEASGPPVDAVPPDSDGVSGDVSGAIR